MRKKIKRMLVPLILLLPLVQVLNSHGASFDCTKAATKVEKMICADAELSRLDEEIAKSCQDALPDSSAADTMQQGQRDWLQQRNQCEDTACLKKAYEERKAVLFSTANAVAQATIATKNNKAALVSSTASEKDPTEIAPITKNYIYKQKKDTGWNVCRDLVKNLEKVRPSKASFNSEVRFDPTMKQFSQPQWQELKIEEHWQEIYAIESYLENGWRLPLPKGIPSFEEWFKGYQVSLKVGFLEKPQPQTGELTRRKLDPRLRMTKVRFESDGPLRTVIAYARERNIVQLWKEREELYEKCPLDYDKDVFICIDPNDEGLDKRFYAKWGEYFEHPGDYIFFYDPDTGRLGNISIGTTTTLILHNGRGYLINFLPGLWEVRHIDHMSVSVDPHSYSGADAFTEFTCEIKIQQKNKQLQ